MTQRVAQKFYFVQTPVSVLNVVCASSFLVSSVIAFVCVPAFMCVCVCVSAGSCLGLFIFFFLFALNKRQKTKNYTEKVK